MREAKIALASEPTHPWHQAAWRDGGEPALVFHLEDAVIIDANPAACTAFSCTLDRLIGMDLTDLAARRDAERLRQALLADQATAPALGEWDLALGTQPAAPFAARLVRFSTDAPTALLKLTPTGPSSESTRLRRLNWALAAYARSSTALIHFKTFDDLVHQVCAAIVGDEDEYLVATVGLAEPGPRKPIRLLSAAGRAAAYIEGLDLSWSEDILGGQGPAGYAIRSGQPFTMRDSRKEPVFSPWRERAARFGIRSSVTVPFQCEDGGVGIVMVYAARPDAFGEQELEVFLKLGSELAFAMSVERARAQLKAAEEARRAAEAAARDFQAELARASRAMSVGAFASSIAHEVNQPVAAIVTNGETALKWLAKDPPRLQEACAALQRIIRDANRTSLVVDRTRALIGKAKGIRERVDIRQLLLETLQFTQAEQTQTGVKVKTAFGMALPPVLADRIQLQQVVNNLIANAIDAMKPVTDRSRVLTVAAGQPVSGQILISVADTGVGLEPGSEERIFDHLFTTKPNGVGLGLAISKSIVEAHDGRILASPNQPYGAVFTFSLPVADI